MKSIAKKNKDFAVNSVIMLTRRVVDIGLGLASVILIARMLGKNGQGVYTLVILLPTMLVRFLNFGIAPATVYHTSQNRNKLTEIIYTNIYSSILFSFSGIAIGVLVILIANDILFKGIDTGLLWLVILGLPPKMMFTFLVSIFMGVQDFKTFNMAGILNKFLFIMLIVCLYVIKVDVISTILAFVIADYLSVLFVLWKLNKLVKLRWCLKFDRQLFRDQMKYGLKAHVSNIFTFLNYRLDMFMIGAFINAAAVGIYSVAVSLGERIWMFSQSIASVLFASIAGLKNEEERNNLTSLVNRNVLFISIVISIGLFVLCDIVVDIMFGEDYQGAVIMLRWLLPGIAIGSVSKVLSNHISGIGKPEVSMYVSGFTILLNVGLNIILIPRIGALGAAIVSSITYSVDALIKILYYRFISQRPFAQFMIVRKKDFLFYGKMIRHFKGKII